MYVCCECRVLSGRGLCDELITRPEESYLLWCVVVCDLETSVNEAVANCGLLRQKQASKLTALTTFLSVLPPSPQANLVRAITLVGPDGVIGIFH